MALSGCDSDFMDVPKVRKQVGYVHTAKYWRFLDIYQHKFVKNKLKTGKFEILFAKTGSKSMFRTLKKGGVGQQKTPLKPL
jgi:hypothetical protein